MGSWSLPWQSMAKATAFRERMGQPWLARVHYDEEEDAYIGTLDDVSTVFWDQGELVGNDHLVDLIADRADEEQQDFDARPLVRESLLLMLKEMELQPFLPKDLSAINVVRDALGLAALSSERELTPFQRRARQVARCIREQGLTLTGFRLQVLGPEVQGIARQMFGVPEGFEDQVVYLAHVKLVDDAESDVEFPEALQICRTTYDRPGLLRVYFTV